MFIHQEKNENQYEVWIDLDKIRSIIKVSNKYEYRVYFFATNSYIEITQETFEKIIKEKGVI